MYQHIYSPWDRPCPLPGEQRSQFLQNVRLLLGSKHCPNLTVAEANFLTSLVNQGTFQAISANPSALKLDEVLDNIKGLLLLSEWVPANPALPPAGLSDGTVFRNAAANLCKQVGLDRLELQQGVSEENAEKEREKIILVLVGRVYCPSSSEHPARTFLWNTGYLETRRCPAETFSTAKHLPHSPQ
ncbi:hypothetical protein BT69DRAFT_370965 [Atractiella rhizophila]|nr:hypothetical protein BT69DRAFT_370965 [Atractiella rhizophila]